MSDMKSIVTLAIGAGLGGLATYFMGHKRKITFGILGGTALIYAALKWVPEYYDLRKQEGVMENAVRIEQIRTQRSIDSMKEVHKYELQKDGKIVPEPEKIINEIKKDNKQLEQHYIDVMHESENRYDNILRRSEQKYSSMITKVQDKNNSLEKKLINIEDNNFEHFRHEETSPPIDPIIVQNMPAYAKVADTETAVDEHNMKEYFVEVNTRAKELYLYKNSGKGKWLVCYFPYSTSTNQGSKSDDTETYSIDHHEIINRNALDISGKLMVISDDCSDNEKSLGKSPVLAMNKKNLRKLISIMHNITESR